MPGHRRHWFRGIVEGVSSRAVGAAHAEAYDAEVCGAGLFESEFLRPAVRDGVVWKTYAFDGHVLQPYPFKCSTTIITLRTVNTSGRYINTFSYARAIFIAPNKAGIVGERICQKKENTLTISTGQAISLEGLDFHERKYRTR